MTSSQPITAHLDSEQQLGGDSLGAQEAGGEVEAGAEADEEAEEDEDGDHGPVPRGELGAGVGGVAVAHLGLEGVVGLVEGGIVIMQPGGPVHQVVSGSFSATICSTCYQLCSGKKLCQSENMSGLKLTTNN